MKKLSEEKRLEGERPLMSETFLRTQDEDTQDEDTERTGSQYRYFLQRNSQTKNLRMAVMYNLFIIFKVYKKPVIV